ncbi:SulP family inorganic anion transporter [uncultured Rhodoblastus sp.]|uniref:SulP family inorganic anion transporter n=1 Tax=uncultured Rhodoblastus sp. TaxID=543037 RepID=UPI0025FFF204|nr:SulP family inorganic anion transporter [uncultured Rhodoblastus sp.]
MDRRIDIAREQQRDCGGLKPEEKLQPSLPLKGAFRRRAESLAADGLAALVLFPVQTTYLLSYTALIYSGPLAFARSAGFSGMLLTTVIAGLATTVGSAFKFAFGTLDNNAMAIMATLVAAVAIDMGGADQASILATVSCGMALAGLVAGALLLIIGCAGAGKVVRLIPTPVTAGFLGTTGWIISAGAVKVAAGQTLALAILLDRAIDARLVVMAAVAGAFAFMARRTRSPFAVPLLIGGCVLLHHSVFAALGLGLAAQRDAGWLLAFPGALGLTIPWSPAVFGRIDWTVLGHHSLGLIVLAVVAPISLLLTTTGLETALREEVDIDRELRVGGFASLLSGGAGGTIGFTAFARSMTLKVAGGQSRLAAVLSAILMGIVPAAFPQALGLVPVTVLGGLLFFLGFGLLYRWVFLTRREMGLREWAIVPTIIVLSIQFSLIWGVLAGIILGCVSFVATYAGGPPIRAAYFGDVAVSNVGRPAAERRVLRETGQERLVLYLQGFLFFGTAHRLFREVREKFDLGAGVRAVILDFGEVDGVDSSAISSLKRIAEIGEERGVNVLFCGVPPVVRDHLGAMASPQRPRFEIVASVDQALERCEENSLGAHASGPVEPASLVQALAGEFRDPTMAAAILGRLESFDVPAGGALMRQGDASNDLAFIETGRAAVFTAFEGAEPIRVRTLVAGTMIGELGFYLDTPRMATIVAETSCRITRITRQDLTRLEREHPQAALEFQRLIAQRLCMRIQDKDHLIEGLVRAMKRPAF